jgi:hypothetical protein
MLALGARAFFLRLALCHAGSWRHPPLSIQYCQVKFRVSPKLLLRPKERLPMFLPLEESRDTTLYDLSFANHFGCPSVRNAPGTG